MNKLITLIGLVGVLLIFFFGMGISLETETEESIMKDVDFGEREVPHTPTILVMVAPSENTEVVTETIREVEIEYVGETRTYADIETTHGKPLLQRTDMGADVAELQALLNEHGASLDIDGKFGDDTRQAVLDFQEANELSVDGFAGEETWGELLELEEEDEEEDGEQRIK